MKKNSNTVILYDDSLMPFGKYLGRAMEDVPASYLLFIYNEGKLGYNNGLKEYIEDNMQVLKKEIEENKTYKNG